MTKDQVKDAPNVEDDGHLSDDDQRRLYDHYAQYLGYGSAGTVAEGGDTGAAGGDDAMTRSEERLRVGTENVPVGRARLRKYVVTENVTQSVPVSREELRVEREPITEENRADATSGPAISEAEHEVTLHAERPVVQKEAVPVERVRVGTEQVADEQTVSEEVRKEEIELDEDSGTKKPRR